MSLANMSLNTKSLVSQSYNGKLSIDHISNGTSLAKPSSPRHLLAPILSSRETDHVKKNTTNDCDPSHVKIDTILRAKVKVEQDALLKGFQAYDEEGSGCVTKGEFRRVLELYCLPLKTEEFNNLLEKVGTNRNGTVTYTRFLTNFCENSTPNSKQEKRAPLINPTHQNLPSPNATVEQVEIALRQQVTGNLKNILKGFRLFDYNRDGKIQRHELRKILENYCFTFTQQQFDRLWQRYDFQHSGILDYHEFLSRLGISSEQCTTALPPPINSQTARLNTQQSQTCRKSGRVAAGSMPAVGPRRILLGPVSIPEVQQRLSFDQTEARFRYEMRQNAATLRKAFQAFDESRSGLINLEDLYAVLSQFVLPMSRDLFSQLMDRCGVKSNNQIQWLTFLERFQDPQLSGNGQTLPIKPAHRANAIMGDNQTVKLDELLKLLHRHINEAYSSLREAFLHINKKGDGQITQQELRCVLEKFKLIVTDSQFKELMLALDPENTGYIDYHHFLSLFEGRESLDGHKWLKSVHRFNNNNRRAILAWKTIEDLMRDKLGAHWRELVNLLKLHDPKGLGFIPAHKMFRILCKVTMPITQEHFDNMLSRLTLRDEKNDIHYLELLALLRVEVNPGDLSGLSTQISDGSEEARADRLADHQTRMMDIDSQALERTTRMSVVELKRRLADRISQHKTQIREAFLAADRQRKGFISRKEFRKILALYSFSMSKEQFKELCEYLGFGSNGSLDYVGFISQFEDSREVQRNSDPLLAQSNHRVNSIRGDEYSMSADEVERRLHSKLRENFSNLRGAFHKFDENNQGFLTKKSFRQLLDAFMCITNDDTFEEVCRRIGVDKNSRIGYRDFLSRFEKLESLQEGHPWLVSVHRYNEIEDAGLQTAVQVHHVLANKVHQNYQDIARAFCHIDNRGKGYITRKEFRTLLHRLNLPMSLEHFKLLWKHYDPAGRGAITHEAFLTQLGAANQFASGDTMGTSEAIIQGSAAKIEQHLDSQQERQQKLTHHQAVLGVHLDTEQLFNALRKHIKDDYKDTYSAFRRYDFSQKGFITPDDCQRMLSNLHLFINDDQFNQLCLRLGFHDNSSTLNYEAFCSAFDENISGPRQSIKESSAAAAANSKPSSENLSDRKAQSKLLQIVANERDSLRKAFQAFDRDSLGRIKANHFRRVLDNFCFPLTDSQFKQVEEKFVKNNFVEYNDFLSTENSSEQVLVRAKNLPNVQAELSPLTKEEVRERVCEVLQARSNLFLEAFKELDVSGTGTLGKSDMRQVLHRLVMRLTDPQFEMFWTQLPLNELNHFEYGKFLQSFTSSDVPTQVATSVEGTTEDVQEPMPRPSSAIFSHPRDNRKQPQVKDYDGLSESQRKLRSVLQKHWRVIFDRCKSMEIEGYISINNFIDIIRAVDSNSVPQQTELVSTARRFGLRTDGNFMYQDLMRNLVALGDVRCEDLAQVRKKLHRAKLPISPTGTDGEYLLRVRRRVIDDWKEMRKLFRENDEQATGTCTAGQFRKLLRRFGVQLNEDEFYQLASHLDTTALRGHVNYNEFIRAFLQTA